MLGLSQPENRTSDILAYISQKYDLSLEQLMVAEEYQRKFEFTGKAYWYAGVVDTKNGDIYKLMVDLEDGSIIEDIYAVQQADQNAFATKYGKLEPQLFDLVYLAVYSGDTCSDGYCSIRTSK